MTWPDGDAAAEEQQRTETDRYLNRLRAARRVDEINDFVEAVVVQAVLTAFCHPSASVPPPPPAQPARGAREGIGHSHRRQRP